MTDKTHKCYWCGTTDKYPEPYIYRDGSRSHPLCSECRIGAAQDDAENDEANGWPSDYSERRAEARAMGVQS